MGSFRILSRSLLGHPAENWEREPAMFSAAVPSCCMAQNRWRHHKGTDHWESQRKSKEKTKNETKRMRQKRLTKRMRSREAEFLRWNVSEQCNTDIVFNNVPWGASLAQLPTIILQSVMITMLILFGSNEKKNERASNHEKCFMLHCLHHLFHPGPIQEKQQSHLDDSFDCR